MYAFLSELLSDHAGTTVFTCFGFWHFCWLIGTVLGTAGVVLYLRKKDGATQQRFILAAIHFAVALYAADFFLMPFAYGEIVVEKLPFHVCTAMCVMCLFSRHMGFLKKYIPQFALLSLVSNFVYLVYPAGLMWHQSHPVSYRVIQTLLFHSSMTLYGLLTLTYEPASLNRVQVRRNFVTIVGMTLWAMLGNALYADRYTFNWFFVVRDPFYWFPEALGPYIMPVLNITVFFVVELLVCAIFHGIRSRRSSEPCTVQADILQ